MQNYNKEEVIKMFDEQFGKAGPNKNSDSIGREAGCDDCSTSIKVREETRAFLSTALDAAFKAGRESMKEEVNKSVLVSSDDISYLDANDNNECVRIFKQNLKALK